MGRKIRHDHKLFYQQHCNGKSIKIISKENNCPVSSIYGHFIKMKWEYNKEIQKERKTHLKVNDNYLDNIDSDDKAYFLGIMLADGYISKGNRFCLKLKKSDAYLVENIFSKFSEGYKPNIDEKSFQLSLNSKKIQQQLLKFGCIRNKTEKGFRFPNIPKEYFGAFVRGYFDGDGSISLRKQREKQVQIYICSIDENFLKEFSIKLLNFNIKSIIFKEKRNGKSLKTPEGKILTNCKDMYTLRIGSHEDKLKFYELIYKNSTIKLNRKFKMFNEYYVNTVLTLESKGSKAVQRIDNETFIDFNKLKSFNFKSWLENIDKKVLYDMYITNNMSVYLIAKTLKRDRGYIKNQLKEYNLSKSPQQPKKMVENIC